MLDQAGEAVLDFVSAAKNLTKIGELTEKVTTIAAADSWRRYTTAIGTDEWRECEFDYFLIACGLAWDDVSKIIAWSNTGAKIAPLIDHAAPPEKRRSLEEAGEAWHAAGNETLVQRAARLGWTKGETEVMRTAPVPPRARARYTHGVSKDEHARRGRVERLSKARRAELDALLATLAAQLADDVERLYVIDRLRQAKRGRPQVSERDLDAWRQDAEANEWDVGRLAEVWGVTRRRAYGRLRQLRSAA